MTGSARPYDPWRDADSAEIPQRARVEQIAVAKEHGALSSRLRKRGQVLGRGRYRLLIRFDGEDKPAGVRPHLVRVVSVNPTSSEGGRHG